MTSQRLKCAVLSKSKCFRTLQLLEYFASVNRPVELVIVETRKRTKFTKSQLLHRESHARFREDVARKTRSSVTDMMRGRLRSMLKKRLPGRWRRNAASGSVTEYCQKLGIPHVSVETHSSQEAVEALVSKSINFAVLGSSGWLFKPPLVPGPVPIINLHPGLLPNHRGLDSNSWAVLDGDPVGSTSFIADQGIDTGPVIHFFEYQISGRDNLLTMRANIAKKRCELFALTLERLESGEYRATKQDMEYPIHRPMSVSELHRANDLVVQMAEKVRDSQSESTR